MFQADDHETVLLLRAVLACVVLVVIMVVSVVLVELYQRKRDQRPRLIEGPLIDVEPGDRVLIQLGYAATVIAVSGSTVVLQLGPEHGDQRITAVRGAIIRRLVDAEISVSEHAPMDADQRSPTSQRNQS